jgi:predicted secreted Zn-dependent protease
MPGTLTSPLDRRSGVIALAVLVLGCGRRPTADCSALPAPTENAFEEHRDVEYYEATGANPNEWLANARPKRPFKTDVPQAFGNTESQDCFRAMYHVDEKECRITAVLISHFTRISLPRWVGVPPEHAEWARKTTAKIAAHEEGHYAINLAQARVFYAAAVATGPAATCDELQARLHSRSVPTSQRRPTERTSNTTA